MAYSISDQSMRLPHQVDLTDDVTNMSSHFPSFNLANQAEKEIEMKLKQQEKEIEIKLKEKEMDLEFKKRIHERLIACFDSDNMDKAFKLKKFLYDRNLLDSPQKPEETSKKIEDDDVIIIENEDDIEIKPIVTMNDIIVKTESVAINNKRQARFSRSSREVPRSPPAPTVTVNKKNSGRRSIANIKPIEGSKYPKYYFDLINLINRRRVAHIDQYAENGFSFKYIICSKNAVRHPDINILYVKECTDKELCPQITTKHYHMVVQHDITFSFNFSSYAHSNRIKSFLSRTVSSDEVSYLSEIFDMKSTNN